MRAVRSIAAIGLLFAALSPATSQKTKEPKRPKLAAAADTNDPQAYYDFGLENLANESDKAADALYWATRLNPNWADAFYARRLALLLTDRRRLMKYWTGDKRTIESDDVRRIDSLYYHALTLNPFVSQRLDRTLLDAVIDEVSREVERSNPGVSGGEVQYALQRMMMQAPPSTRAWRAYGDGNFDDAVKYYGMAIKQSPKSPALRIDRARVFYQTGQMDSALADMTSAIELMKTRDKKDLVYIYESKALTEHSIAMIQRRLDRTDSAKSALGRALQEDLSYYPAHVQLGFIALEGKDTTTMLNEMDLAAQLRPDDAAVHYLYGFTLGLVGRATDAEVHLRKALELDPVYAAPHHALADLYAKQSKPAEALAQYKAFVATAAKRDARRADAEAQIAALSTASAKSP